MTVIHAFYTRCHPWMVSDGPFILHQWDERLLECMLEEHTLSFLLESVGSAKVWLYVQTSEETYGLIHVQLLSASLPARPWGDPEFILFYINSLW